VKTIVFVLIALMICSLSIPILEASVIIIEEPPISDVSIKVYWEQTGNDQIQISNMQTLVVNVTQHSTVEAGCSVSALCDKGKVALYPVAQGTGGIEPKETATITFGVSNLGVEQQIDNIPITIKVFDGYTGEELAKETVYATLLATLTAGQTVLNVKAVEKETGKQAVGVQIQAIFPSNGQGEQTQEWTNTKGEAALNLQYQAGGAFVGEVKLQTLESEDYYSANQTETISVPGIYDVVLEISAKNPEMPAEEEPINWTFIIVASIIAIAVIISVAIYTKSKK
jgi:hypothetical protein